MTKNKQMVTPKVLCAIYCRKSTEEGLDMDFNSLDAQREACESYIASQKAEGWHLLPDRYDDGGFTGGNLERPALKRLMADVQAGKINQIVIYKLDRLTRSLMDFAKLVEVFDRHNVTFSSVTQQFSTTTSMGRLTLNMLLSFAQFEREISAERIRDKFAASKKKGMWMGGHPPLGYIVQERKLVIHPTESETVRTIFRRFIETNSVTQLIDELAESGAVGKNGHSLDKGAIYRILGHHVYVGEIAYQGEIYAGEHQAIIDRATWDAVRTTLANHTPERMRSKRVDSPAPLKGIISCSYCDRAMKPTFTRKAGKLYRYYTCQGADKGGSTAPCPLRNVSAGEVEKTVLNQVRGLLGTPEVMLKTFRAMDNIDETVPESKVMDSLRNLESLWDELFPMEQSRLMQLLVGRVNVSRQGIDVTMRSGGLQSLLSELE
ncbi:recombinase family protein [Candidatus Magnetaquicoccus inordinatus]|uniref:recombinase family protein n=1 Tax=Candidatus Magnetaquicoccus inordinatus TaxID=2496818 RepID=UPI00187D3937|nr:recombinase family protein [Candidatus Magnetaquicoccus inordinatus]